jgi:hypothetical protein
VLALSTKTVDNFVGNMAGHAATALILRALRWIANFCWQPHRFSKINNLAQFRANTDRNACEQRLVAAQHVFWG